MAISPQRDVALRCFRGGGAVCFRIVFHPDGRWLGVVTLGAGLRRLAWFDAKTPLRSGWS